MNEIKRGISIVAILLAMYFLFNAMNGTASYNMAAASAIQVTQVYSELTFNAVMAGVFFIIAFGVESLVNN
jgi:hypothetical protein